MASVKLTTTIRDGIRRDLLIHRYQDVADKLVARQAVLASAIYEDHYSKHRRDELERLPEGWVPDTNIIGVQFNGSGSSYGRLQFNGMHNIYRNVLMVVTTIDRVKRRVRYTDLNGCMVVYEQDHKFSIQAAILKAAVNELEDEIVKVRYKADAMLRSVTTIGALVKSWPEIEPFTKPYNTPPRQLPTLPVQQLNDMFKLPVTEEAA